MLYAIRHEAPTPLSNSTLPPEAAAIVDRCLQKDPADRYPTAAALAEDIARLVDAEGWHPGPRAVQSVSAVGTHAPDPDSSAPTRPMSPPAGARPRRLRWLLGAGLLALAILLGREALRERSPFTTEIRAAVLAVEDRTGSESSELAAGLTVALSDLVSEVARHHPSMWVAPARHVAYAAPIDAAEARNTLGVNRVLTGQLVRFEDRLRITLTLEDTDDGQALDTVIVDFRTDDAGPLRDVLPSRFVRMFHLDAGAADDLAARLPTDGRAGADYLAGLGALEMAPDRAVTRLESAALRDSAFVPARERLGLAWLHQHRDRQDEASLARALDVLRPVRDAPGPGPGGADWLGDAFDGKGDVDSAMASYRAALARDPGDSYAANRIAKQFRGEGRFEEGAAVLRGVIEAAPDYSANHRDLANHLYKSDRSAEAEKEFQRALELAPDDPYSINALGAIHYAAGEWPRARELFERSFRLLPTYASCSNVGLMYFYEGNFKASARYYEYAVALGDTTDADVWGNLASSLYWVPGQRERAVTIYRRAIGLTEEQRAADPENVELRVDLADFHAMAGDEAEARELIDGLKGKLGRNGDLFYRVGCSLELLGDREAAMEKLSMAVRLGYPISILRGTPELGDFVTDVRFLDLVRALEEAPR
jgi:tetratricopeptide (TPR) repeat protein